MAGLRILVLLRRLRGRPDGTPAARLLGACDEAALRTAAALAGTAGASAQVTALAAGPAGREDAALQAALAGGAARAVRVDDPALEAMDYFGMARALAGAARHLGFDLVLTGDRSEDEGQGAVGPAVAELLGIPHLSGARDAKLAGKELQVVRREAGTERTLALPLPALAAIASFRSGAPGKRAESAGGAGATNGGGGGQVTTLDLAAVGLQAAELKHREPLLGRAHAVRLARNATLVSPEDLVARLREERLIG